MEIAVFSGGIRIKTKQATLFVELLEEKVKNPVDATLLLGTNQTKQLFSENLGVIFQGAGEYEVKGVKITGFRAEGDVMYTLSADGMTVFVGKVTSALKAKDKLHEHDMALFIADEVLTQATMGQLNGTVLVFSGEKAGENMQAFGKEAVTPINKYSLTKDKLPSETEFVLLG